MINDQDDGLREQRSQVRPRRQEQAPFLGRGDAVRPARRGPRGLAQRADGRRRPGPSLCRDERGAKRAPVAEVVGGDRVVVVVLRRRRRGAGAAVVVLVVVVVVVVVLVVLVGGGADCDDRAGGVIFFCRLQRRRRGKKKKTSEFEKIDELGKKKIERRDSLPFSCVCCAFPCAIRCFMIFSRRSAEELARRMRQALKKIRVAKSKKKKIINCRSLKKTAATKSQRARSFQFCSFLRRRCFFDFKNSPSRHHTGRSERHGGISR